MTRPRRRRVAAALLLLAAGAGLGVAQEAAPPTDSGPEFHLGARTTRVGWGAAEVVWAETGAAYRAADGAAIALAEQVGTVLEIDPALTLTGPLEVAICDCGALRLEAGAEAELLALPGSLVRIHVLRGVAHATNGSITLRLGPDSIVDIGTECRFTNLRGDASIVDAGVAPRDGAPSDEVVPSDFTIPANDGPVSPFRPFR